MSVPMTSSAATLDVLEVGRAAQVKALALDAVEADWLRAVGLVEGVAVTVLRRAAFGGPLHLRLSTGLELAVDRALAARVEVSP